MKKIDITHRIETTTSDGTSVNLYPLDEYLSDILLKFILDGRRSDKHDGSLTLVNYKPMATFSFVTSPGYMPFIIEISASEDYDLHYPSYIGVECCGKTIHLNLDNLSKIIKSYGFRIHKETVDVSVIQGATVKDFDFDVVILEYAREDFDTRFDDLKLAEAKIKTLIQALESNPTLRKDFHIEYIFYTNPYSDYLKYPYIYFIPEGAVNHIADFLLSLYQQNYGIITKLPPEFVPNENIENPELQQFLDKLPLDMIVKTAIGTYGSYPAVLLPEGNYSQYLAGNERVVNLGKNVVIVFGNSQEQQTLTPEQQNVEQNKEEGNSNTEQNKVEKVSNNVIAEGLGKQIQVIYETIDDDTINYEEKTYRLKALNEALDKLGKAITNALKSQTPLNANELRKYTEDIVKSAGLLYTNNFEYYLDYYENSLSETEELEVLVTLLTYIGKTMYDIDKKIKEYNSQQLTY